MMINIQPSMFPCDKADLRTCKEFVALKEMSNDLPTLKALFATDPQRFAKYSISIDELLFDYSKNLITPEILDSLVALAKSRNVEQLRDAMFRGEEINTTEGRAVLHIASRADAHQSFCVNGHNVVPDIIAQKVKMGKFIETLYRGDVKGFSGKSIRSVINLGVGGSDLGGVMATQALTPYLNESVDVHFVSTIDGTQLLDLLPTLDHETSLFILCSKSFTTIDTMSNVETVKAWYESKSGNDSWKAHFAGVSANTQTMSNFGIPEDRQFIFGDYIGGRYSVSSTIGLPIAIAIGMDKFDEFLNGMRLIDEHFISTPIDKNIPFLMGLLQVWNIEFLNAHAQAILPYAQHLSRFPAYLTQMEMESLGKTVTRDNKQVDYHTGAVLFGEMGSNGQHSFYQLLHQGTRFVMADFIAPVNGPHNNGYHQRLTLGNCLAQSKALAFGFSLDDLYAERAKAGKQHPPSSDDIHRVHSGNRPSNTILVDKITPKTLGMLVALYEHKVFVQAAIWNINAYDQWGVELGKKMAADLYEQVGGGQRSGDSSDSSTLGLLNAIAQRWGYSDSSN